MSTLPTQDEVTPEREPRPFRLGWGLAVACGLLAGLVAWAGAEAIERSLSAPLISEFEVAGSQQFAMREQALRTKTSLTYGLLGASVGLLLGLAGGYSSRSAPGSLLGGGVGLLLGAATAAGVSQLAVPFFTSNERPLEDDLLLPLMTHGAIWVGVGLVGGLALGLGLGRGRATLGSAILGGVVGALVATMIYEVGGAMVFPLDKTSQPVAEGMYSRLFGLVVVAVGVALGAAFGVRQPVAKAPRSVVEAG